MKITELPPPVTAYSQVMRAVWDETEERSRESFRYFLWGVFYAWEGRFEEAVDAFRRAVEADPEMVGSYVELGMVYACLGRYEEMVDVLRQAISVGPSAVRAYLGEGPQSGAREHDPRSVDGVKEIASRLVVSAASHIASGRDREAAGKLEMAVRINRRNGPAMMLLAVVYLLMREDAAKAGEKSVLRDIPELAAELFWD